MGRGRVYLLLADFAPAASRSAKPGTQGARRMQNVSFVPDHRPAVTLCMYGMHKVTMAPRWPPIVTFCMPSAALGPPSFVAT